MPALARSSVLADTYRDYIAVEAIADPIRTFQAQLVPGLLQTPGYLRAVTVASQQWRSADGIEQFVRVRPAGQERLTEDPPLHLWADLSEGVLLQQVGRPQVMRSQLRHILDAGHPLPGPLRRRTHIRALSGGARALIHRRTKEHKP